MWFLVQCSVFCYCSIIPGLISCPVFCFLHCSIIPRLISCPVFYFLHCSIIPSLISCQCSVFCTVPLSPAWSHVQCSVFCAVPLSPAWSHVQCCVFCTVPLSPAWAHVWCWVRIKNCTVSMFAGGRWSARWWNHQPDAGPWGRRIWDLSGTVFSFFVCVRVGGGGGVECGLVFVVEDMGERENKRSDHLFEFRTGIIHRLGEMKAQYAG